MLSRLCVQQSHSRALRRLERWESFLPVGGQSAFAEDEDEEELEF